MNRHNAMLVTISVFTLSLFTFVYTYYGTKTKSKPAVIENTTIITATTGTPTVSPKKQKNNPKRATLDKQLVTILEQHALLLAENINLIDQLKMLNDSDALEKTYFISTLNEKPFKGTKQKIAFVKKEVRMLKKDNGQIKKEIKNLQKKK